MRNCGIGATLARSRSSLSTASYRYAVGRAYEAGLELGDLVAPVLSLQPEGSHSRYQVFGDR